MHYFAEFLVFFVQTVVVVLAVIVVLLSLVGMISKNKDHSNGKLNIKKLKHKYNKVADAIQEASLSKKAFKHYKKQHKNSDKKEHKTNKELPRLFVINFHGDMKANAAQALSEEVNGVLLAAKEGDEVMLNLDSPGGVVNGYGLAATQLVRLKEAGIKLTICIDKMAASGGYMMACVADKVIAAPFAIIGSIGVVAQVPNFHGWMKEHKINFEQITAGEYKRTLTMFGENTDKAREKVQEEVNDIHELFKNFIAENRPQVDLNKVATGEHWFAKQALELKLVDELMTSDDFLLAARDNYDLYNLHFKLKRSLGRRISQGAEAAWLKVTQGSVVAR